MNLNLSNEVWSFKSTQDEQWMPAVVPGCVHTDLLRADQIKNPFYGTNEHDLQWIDKRDWEYQTVFTLENSLLNEEVHELVFHGLDTYAEVYLNNELILEANNMFRSWNVNVTGKLLASDNQLNIRFRSPITEDLNKLQALGYALPASNDQSELGGLGEDKVSVFARKAPYHYGWDWGPRFVTSGIWRPIELQGYSGIKLRDVYIRQDVINDRLAELTALVSVEVVEAGLIDIYIETAGLSWHIQEKLEAGSHQLSVPIQITQPQLWWCRGLGEANLYTFSTEVRLTTSNKEYCDHSTMKTGLRTIKLVRDRDATGKGATFHFELNGVPVFAKGANHIPNDSFITEVTEARYRSEIAAAVEANMNMLRIWGGGIYEPNIFYSLCDENGIMVWQDFMFACSMYPGDEEFLQNVKQEAIDNVIRLRNHPSIVLWCGNNEIDTAWAHYDENAGWGWKKDYSLEQRDKIWADYEKIFHYILPEIVANLHHTVDYWPSSPLVSLTRNKEQHAHPQTSEGDIHYWGVWHSVEPLENYNIKIGRFMSEYGFQSFPEYRTIRSFAEESDLSIESKVMLAHQKNGNGNRLIKEYMDSYMKEAVDFKGFLYLSQVLQADAMKMAIEAHRRNMPFCMGSLYWQMNDCWPVASWSGIDYYGRWKALHYYAKRSFAPILISAEQKHDQLELYVVSDQLTGIHAELMLELYSTGGQLLFSEKKEIITPVNTSVSVWKYDVGTLLGANRKEAVVLSVQLRSKQGELLSSYQHYFVKNQQLELIRPTISIEVDHTNDGTTLTLKSDVLAKQVVVISEQEGIWSDNYFDLIPGQSYPISFSRFDQQGGYRLGHSGETTVHSMFDFVKNE